MQVVTEEHFVRVFTMRCNGEFSRALAVFRQFGPALSPDVQDVIDRAVRLGKVEDVLTLMEAHYQDELRHQDLNYRGMIFDGYAKRHPTREFFARLRGEVLSAPRIPSSTTATGLS